MDVPEPVPDDATVVVGVDGFVPVGATVTDDATVVVDAGTVVVRATVVVGATVVGATVVVVTVAGIPPAADNDQSMAPVQSVAQPTLKLDAVPEPNTTFEAGPATLPDT